MTVTPLIFASDLSNLAGFKHMDLIDQMTKQEAFLLLRDYAEAICWPLGEVVIAVLVRRDRDARQSFLEFLEARGRTIQ